MSVAAPAEADKNVRGHPAPSLGRGCVAGLRLAFPRHIWYETASHSPYVVPMTSRPETIAIAADHAGFPLKEILKQDLEAMGFHVLDLGTRDETTSVDYPDFGAALAAKIKSGEVKRGVLVCGTGIGISIAANREPAVRCALVHDGITAKLARDHNDANVIAMGARVIGIETAREALATFLATPFSGGERHNRRVAKLSPEVKS